MAKKYAEWQPKYVIMPVLLLLLVAFSFMSAGNTTPIQGLLVAQDNGVAERPTVDIVYPAQSSTVFGSVMLAAQALDDKPVRVVFFVDDIPLTTSYSNSQYYVAFWTAPHYPGTHVVKAVAINSLGQTATSIISVRVV